MLEWQQVCAGEALLGAGAALKMRIVTGRCARVGGDRLWLPQEAT